MRWKGEDAAELPVRIQYATTKVQTSLSGTMYFSRASGEWYFSDFGFMLFPWGVVVVAMFAAVAFSVGAWMLVRRSQRCKRATSPAFTT
jgi:hypothetical protein